MDPEVVHVHPLLQRQLLFRDRASVPGWDRSLTNREERSPSGYLLGLLTHQASWDTMQDCLDWLLGQGDSWNRFVGRIWAGNHTHPVNNKMSV